MRQTAKRNITLLCVSILTFGSVAVAHAEPSPKAADAEQPTFVTVDPNDGVMTSQGVFYPTGALDDSTTVVILDDKGNLPAGLTQAGLERLLASRSTGALSARAGVNSSAAIELTPALVAEFNGTAKPLVALAGNQIAYSARMGAWSMYTGKTIWGYDDTARVSYGFDVQDNTAQIVQGQGLGYYQGYNGSQMGLWSSWYAIGVAASGDSREASIPWGNVIGTAQFQAKSLNSLLANGYWWPGK